MATLQELEAAFIKADDAGNVDDARAFAAEIKRLRAKPTGAKVPSWLPQPTPEQEAAVSERLGVAPAFFGGMRTGAARGFDDELYAAGTAAMGLDTGLYGKALEEYRAAQKARKESSPFATAAGEVAGATIANPWGILGSAPTWGARIAQAAGIGGIEGAARAAGDTEEGSRLKNAGIGALVGIPLGAVAGGVLEAGRAGVNLAKNTLRSFTDAGRERILAEHLNEGVGAARQGDVARALMQAREIVPGSLPTAGEAVADIPEAAVIAAMQRDLARKNIEISKGGGSIAGAFKAREADQEAARRAAMQAMAGTDDDMTRALAARASGADYKAIGGDVVPTDDTLSSLMTRPSMQAGLEGAKKLAAEAGRALPDDPNAYTVDDMQTLKIALDDMLKNPERFGLGAAQAKAIGNTREQFISWLSEQSPAWQATRQEYARLSQPINRMDVARELGRRMTDPATGAERASRLKSAVENAPQTIKRATGAPRFTTMEQVDQNLARVTDALMKDVGRTGRFESLASGVEGMRPGDKFPRLPNILEPGVALTNRILSMGGQSSQEAIDALAAQLALNPQRMGTIMSQFPAPTRQKVIDALMRQMFLAPVAQESASQFAE